MPERGDPHRLAELDRSYEGELPLSGFVRLGESILASDATVVYAIRFDRDRRGRGRIRGEVHAQLPMKCQRCLETFQHPVDRKWRLALIEDPAEDALLDEGEDACLVTDPGMKLANLIEDELILALPVVPRHPEYADCRLPVNPAAAEPEPLEAGDNPFSELSRLKRGN